jgi:hypothetical protein
MLGIRDYVDPRTGWPARLILVPCSPAGDRLDTRRLGCCPRLPTWPVDDPDTAVWMDDPIETVNQASHLTVVPDPGSGLVLRLERASDHIIGPRVLDVDQATGRWRNVDTVASRRTSARRGNRRHTVTPFQRQRLDVDLLALTKPFSEESGFVRVSIRCRLVG